ncbi:MAG: glycosyltransferase [Acidimicrobiales bacterium]
MATESRSESIAMTNEPSPTASSVVVCSLEGWSEVRRRIRILVDELVELDPSLRVLYVTPAHDVVHELRNRRSIRGEPKFDQVGPRIHVLRPRKWLPRVVGPFADRSLERQVLHAIRVLGLDSPLVWVNDASYARFAVRSGWPVVYDITDDWLLTALAPRQLERLMDDERLLLERSEEVVVCSPALERSRGHSRKVELIPNAVDVELFSRPRPRPDSLPPAPVVLYAGTLHEERVDVPLILELAEAAPHVSVVLLGPDCLTSLHSSELRQPRNVLVLGPRPYSDIPAYLQHADVLIVPHLVNAFTESLDPIKAYECLAAGRPTVATPVAGFRHLGPPIVVAERSAFVAAVLAALEGAGTTGAAVPPDQHRAPIPSWHERALAMASVMDRARHGGDR